MNVDSLCLKKPKVLPTFNDLEAQAWNGCDLTSNDSTKRSTKIDHGPLIFLPFGQQRKENDNTNLPNFYQFICKCKDKKEKSKFSISILRIVPWVLVLNSFIQIFVHICQNDRIFKKLVYSPLKRNECWRYLTYNYLHTGTVHLILNIIIQIILAIPIEIEQGHLRVAFIYFGGVISGALGASVFQPTLLMVGASAGVYSLLISHIPHIIMNFDDISYRYSRISSVIILCISDVSFVFIHCLIKGNADPRISVSAHGSGAVAGFLLGFVIYGCKDIDSFRNVKFCSAFLYTFLVLMSIVYIVLH